MAIAFDTFTSYPDTGGTTTSHTFTHTVTGGAPIIFVGFIHYGTTTDICTGVTYNGVAMTRVNTIATATSGRAYLYALSGPSQGANTVAITLSSAQAVYGGATSYTGAGLVDANNTGTVASNTTLTVNVTTTKDKEWLVSLWVSNLGRTPSAGTNTTQRFTNSSAVAMSDSNGAQTPAGSYGQTTTTTVLDGPAMIVASFPPAQVGNPLAFFL
jgi:hypothetical protein